MNHENDCGAVAFLQDIEHPISVARKVMEDTPHVMLVGKGAYDFAIEKGFNVGIISRSVIVINWLLAILVIGGTRVIARFILSEHIKFSILNYEFKSKTDNVDSGKSRVLIYGAGDAGVQLSLALNNSSQFHPVGFFDDNKDLQGSSVSGLNVYSVNDIEHLINKLKVNEKHLVMQLALRSL
jgi:FlaA1/EpsC-like NDP-sugar epimerase